MSTTAPPVGRTSPTGPARTRPVLQVGVGLAAAALAVAPRDDLGPVARERPPGRDVA